MKKTRNWIALKIENRTQEKGSRMHSLWDGIVGQLCLRCSLILQPKAFQNFKEWCKTKISGIKTKTKLSTMNQWLKALFLTKILDF